MFENDDRSHTYRYKGLKNITALNIVNFPHIIRDIPWQIKLNPQLSKHKKIWIKCFCAQIGVGLYLSHKDIGYNKYCFSCGYGKEVGVDDIPVADLKHWLDECSFMKYERICFWKNMELVVSPNKTNEFRLLMNNSLLNVLFYNDKTIVGKKIIDKNLVRNFDAMMKNNLLSYYKSFKNKLKIIPLSDRIDINNLE